jgi:fibronectin-binding autotransporter adhesin
MLLRMLNHACRSVQPGRPTGPKRVRPLLEALEDRWAPAITATWQGGTNNLWSVGTNWSGGQAPGLGDTAIIDGTVNCTIDGLAPAGVNVLQIKSTYTGTLNVVDSFLVGATGVTSEMAGGTLTGSHTLEIDAGTFNWTGGTLGAGIPDAPPATPANFIQVDSGATFNIQTGATSLARAINNGGTVNFTATNDVTTWSSTNITNLNGGTFSFQSDNGFVVAAGSSAAQFNNAGKVQKSGTTGTSGIPFTFTNAGANALIQIQTGTLYFSGTVTQSSGTTTIYAGATLQVFSVFTMSGGTLQGAGTGTSTLRGNLTMSGGSLYVGGDNIVGTFNVTNNYTQTGGTLYIDVKTGTPDTWDDLEVGNVASLGGNLTVTTAPGTPQPGHFAIITYATLSSGTDFASFTWTGYTYTTDTTSSSTEYRLED